MYFHFHNGAWVIYNTIQTIKRSLRFAEVSKMQSAHSKHAYYVCCYMSVAKKWPIFKNHKKRQRLETEKVQY